MTYLIPEKDREELLSPDGQRIITPEVPEDLVNLRNAGWRTKAEHDLAAASDEETAARVVTQDNAPHSAHDSAQPDAEKTNVPPRRPRAGQQLSGDDSAKGATA